MQRHPALESMIKDDRGKRRSRNQGMRGLRNKIVRKLGMILFGIVFISLSINGYGGYAQQPPSSIQLYFFYAEDCQPCQTILQGYFPTLKSMFPSLDIRTFDVGNPVYYEALADLEKKLNRRGDELPVVIIGDQLLSGEMEVMERLNPLLLEYQAKGGASLPPLATPSAAKTSEKKFTVDLFYFYQEGCPKCDRANVLLRYLAKKYPHLHVKEIDLNTPDGKRLNESLSNRLNLPVEKRLIAPTVFIGKDYLPPEEMIEVKVETLIRKYEQGTPVMDAVSEKPSEPPPSVSPTPEEMKKAEESMIGRFKSLGILTIVSAGLIDGVNPCAFATLIFFISYLTLVGRRRSEILWVGIGFSAAVFVTYLLIGIGILSFVQHLSFMPLFSKIVYLLTVGIALFLGIYSLHDYIQLKRGRPSEMKLQLPNFLKKRIHRTIREKSGTPRYLAAAIVTGVVISLLEFTCTGQVYLPTVLFVTNISSLRASAFSFLILYNVMFVVPLLIIFSVIYWGVTSEQLAFFLQRRASTIKLFTSLLFFALAGILIGRFI
jgi:thiol-disulfide isomerase/thioredoxin